MVILDIIFKFITLSQMYSTVECGGKDSKWLEEDILPETQQNFYLVEIIHLYNDTCSDNEHKEPCLGVD